MHPPLECTPGKNAPPKNAPPSARNAPPLMQTGARVVFDPIKKYVLTTTHGQDLPHFAGFFHLARFSVK